MVYDSTSFLEEEGVTLVLMMRNGVIMPKEAVKEYCQVINDKVGSTRLLPVHIHELHESKLQCVDEVFTCLLRTPDSSFLKGALRSFEVDQGWSNRDLYDYVVEEFWFPRDVFYLKAANQVIPYNDEKIISTSGLVYEVILKILGGMQTRFKRRTRMPSLHDLRHAKPTGTLEEKAQDKNDWVDVAITHKGMHSTNGNRRGGVAKQLKVAGRRVLQVARPVAGQMLNNLVAEYTGFNANQAAKTIQKQRRARQKRHDKNAGMSFQQATSAPVTMSVGTRGGKPRIRTVQGKPVMTNRILLGTLNGYINFDSSAGLIGTAGTAISSKDLLLSPVNDLLFQTALPATAENYERWRPKNVRLEYVPTCTTGTKGRVVIGWIADSSTPVPTNIISASNMVGCAADAPYKALDVTCRASKNEDLYVSHYINAFDRRKTTAGRFFYGTTGAEADDTEFGYLYLEYEIELMIPYTPTMSPGCTGVSEYYLDDNVVVVTATWTNLFANETPVEAHDALLLTQYCTVGGIVLPPGAYEYELAVTMTNSVAESTTAKIMFNVGSTAGTTTPESRLGWSGTLQQTQFVHGIVTTNATGSQTYGIWVQMSGTTGTLTCLGGSGPMKTWFKIKGA
jgi:hypothetical protein